MMHDGMAEAEAFGGSTLFTSPWCANPIRRMCGGRSSSTSSA